MGTTQTAIARLESGRQSPSMRTLQDFAHATGFCLEIAFVRTTPRDAEPRTGLILMVSEPDESLA
jgi:transcriptional regulator with XRE-family HTH domain